MNKVEKIKAEIERRKNQFVSQAESFHKIGKEDKESYYAALASNMNSLSCFLDSLEEESVSNDLEEESKKYSSCIYLEEVLSDGDKEVLKERLINTFKAGAQWGKEQTEIQIKAQSIALPHGCPKKEPVSNDLEKAAHSYVDTTIEWFDSENNPCCYPAFEAGAQWQKERDQSTIELAEDHAYLAGQEKIIEKACEWLNNFYSEDRHCYFVEEDIDNFKKAMEE